MKTETPHLTQLCDFNDTKTCACILCFLYVICFGFLGLTRLLTSYRMSTRGSGGMICDVMLMIFDVDFLNPTIWHALCCVWFIDCYCFPVSLCEAKVYVYEILDLTIFESSINYTWITFQSPWWDWSVYFDLDDVMLWHVWLDHFGSLWSVLFWDTFWLLVENQSVLWFTSRYFPVAH